MADREKNEDGNKKPKYLKNEKSFLDATKRFFIIIYRLSFGKKKRKVEDTSFKIFS